MGSSEQRSADGTNIGRWLVNVSGDLVLPMTTSEVVDGLRKGMLSERALVWRIGMNDWTSISDVPQLRLVGGSRTPPPLDEPLAVYDRPAASSTFSESARVDWQGAADAAHFTPVPSVPAPLTMPPPSTLANSLAPTTTEANPGGDATSGSPWDDLDELLANERRADQRSSRRVVLGAALGSAMLAALFALWLLRSPAPHRAEPPVSGAQASDATIPPPKFEASALPSASVAPPAPEGPRPAPQAVAPHSTRRTTRTTRTTMAENEAPVGAPGAVVTPDASSAAPSLSVVPTEPSAAASVAPEIAPEPIAPAPVASDRP